ncbi:ornithine--oxo-acid transaminase [Candidatus Azambacteria bacterium RIFOXYD1_FULL_42_11]|uniref:ornithine aminotransferase n=1 Tax=Candidatus Azambacteria bacterium RIFOXYD1_FULL_42_11 TaxID=1797310 RepID=A0A1F5CGP9_9BACT|nr:MAG: ornithine--oxo-acid transaminase [Candidatus Azambacteria bacterium RIFOXYD1_FULL_42_11]
MGKRTKYLVRLAKKHLPRNYAPPDDFVIRSGFGCWQKDVEEKEYLDMLACYSAANLGHGNPEIAYAIGKQTHQRGIICNANCFWEEQKILFARDLVKFCNDFGLKGLDMVLIMNSGAEAVETAMKIARKWGYTKKKIPIDQAEIIACRDNFHGRTLGAISLSTVPQYTELFGPLLPGTIKIPFADENALFMAINKNTAVFITEAVQGEGGVIIPPEKYLLTARNICTANNVLLVVDEIQSGFGRTGKMFACNYNNVIPDMIILGKALGGGIVISAVVGRKEVMDVFEPNDHGSTFGGNPLSSAVGRTFLRIMRRKRLDKRAEHLGKYFKKELEKIAEKSPHILEIRTKGLWIAIEVRHDGPTAHGFCQRLHKERILCKETREYTIRMSPPLVITKEELDFALEKIRKVFVK